MAHTSFQNHATTSFYKDQLKDKMKYGMMSFQKSHSCKATITAWATNYNRKAECLHDVQLTQCHNIYQQVKVTITDFTDAKRKYHQRTVQQFDFNG